MSSPFFSPLQSAILQVNPKGGWRFRDGIKNSVVMFNPRFWPQGMLRRCKKLIPSLHKDIEISRKKLSSEEGKRYWRRHPLYLQFGYWLLRQGGQYLRNDDEEIGYVCCRELWGLLKQLGLWEKYGQNKDDALTILDRTLRIYSDMGYLSDYRWMESKRGSKQKLRLERSLDKFPHLQQPEDRFYMIS